MWARCGALRWLVALSVMLCSCTGEEHADRLARLVSENDSLRAVQEQRERMIRDFFLALGEIQDQLAIVLQREPEIVQNLLEAPEHHDPHEIYARVDGMIRELSALLDENRMRIKRLEARLPDATAEVQWMEKLLFDKKREIELKDSTIRALLEQIDCLESRNESLQNQVYVVSGTREALLRLGVVEKRGFWLFGQHLALRPDFNQSAFTPIDRRDHSEIPFPHDGRGVRLITGHPEGSFQLVEAEGRTRLIILNPEAFWRRPYLVVETF